ncbi:MULTISPECIES: hypothetical protein [unclassified Kitasatospora]|uniref:hypothetical protein n=1 Tax=unclassified Kitasatospora TaxID=2633591 RepID=UPI0034055D30
MDRLTAIAWSDMAGHNAHAAFRPRVDGRIEVPPIPIAGDLSNLDVLVDAIKPHLRAKGYDLK